MKKFLVVLTILVLAAGFAFADATINGSFKGAYKFDFDAETYGYNPADKTSVKLNLAVDTKEFAGEGSVYAKAAASVEFFFNSAGYYENSDVDKTYYWSNDFEWKLTGDVDKADLKGAIAFGLDYVEIVGEKWSLDLINTLYKADYATDKIDSLRAWSNNDEKYITANYSYNQSLASKSTTIKGVTFKYNDYGSLSFGLNGTTSGVTSMVVAAETADFDFNGVNLKAFVGYSVDSSVKKFAGSLKAGYSAEKLSATVAGDFGWNETDDEFNFDVAVNANIAPVTLDAYYASKTSATVRDSHKLKLATDTDSKLLSAQVVFNVADLVESVPVKVTITGNDILDKNDKRDLAVVASTTAIENFTIEGYFKKILTTKKPGASVEFTGIENVTLGAGVSYEIDKEELCANVSAEYKHDIFTANAEVSMTYDSGSDAEFGFHVGAETTKLVDGATIGLLYHGGKDNRTPSDTTLEYGYIKAYCNIAF